MSETILLKVGDVVVTDIFYDDNKRKTAKTICKCGLVKNIRYDSLQNKRCDYICRHRNNGPTYRSWEAMKTRCNCANRDNSQYYIGRNISYCDSWEEFRFFLDDMGERPEGCTLDRIDNNGNYNKENCKWSTVEEQTNNRRSNKFITYNNKTQTYAQWERELGLRQGTISDRINKLKWTEERALGVCDG